MGEIRKRGDKWWIRYYRGGRRFEESARTTKWEVARDLLRDKEGDIAKGIPVSSSIGRYRFEDAAKDIVAEYTVNARRNKAGRVFPFTDELRTLLTALQAEQKALQKKSNKVCPYVFQRNGKRMKSFRGAWAEACEGAGCPDRIPHDLRRSAVRNMERSGLSRSVAMQLTGHKTESVYRRYAITSEADLREGVARLNVPPLAATGTTGTKKGQSTPSGTVSRFKRSRKR